MFKLKKDRLNEIELKPLTLEDGKNVFKLFDNAETLEFYSESPILKEEYTTDFIHKITSNGNWTWKISKSGDSNSFLGICSLHHYSETNKSIEIGGTLFSEFWGKGLMLNAFQLLINEIMLNPSVKRIIGKTSTANNKALKLVKKLGFRVLYKNRKETIVIKYID